MKSNIYSRVISKNLNEISAFFTSKFNGCSNIATKHDRLKANCPYCDRGENRQKLTINLDWGNFKCFRCEESGSLSKLLKYCNLDIEFIDLLNNLTSMSLYDIKTMLKSNSANSHIINESKNENVLKVKKFITDNGLVNVKKIKLAYKYALDRTNGNENEIETYLADDKYIYVPIVTNNDVMAYMGRRYIELDSIPRYNMNTLEPDKPIVGFLDEVESNFSVNSLYIAEGYFDSYAINYAFANYVSICTFGKTNTMLTINEMIKAFPFNTKIYLTLDSPKKDKDIVKAITTFGKKLSEHFTNVYVVELPDGDPADILKNNSSFVLRQQLTENVMPYLKYTILNNLRGKK